jgi:hypothetical protein
MSLKVQYIAVQFLSTVWQAWSTAQCTGSTVQYSTVNSCVQVPFSACHPLPGVTELNTGINWHGQLIQVIFGIVNV